MKTIDMDCKPEKMKIGHPLSECIELSDYFGPKMDVLKCPVCGFDYSHSGEITILNSDRYAAWEGRGECLVIPFYGECGHRWNVCIGYHKGQNFLFTDKGEDDSQ